MYLYRDMYVENNIRRKACETVSSIASFSRWNFEKFLIDQNGNPVRR